MWKTIRSNLKINGKYFVGLMIASVIGGLTTTAVQAAIPDNGNINSCYKGTKTFYLTDPAGNCKAGETPLSWSQSGGGEKAQAYGYIDASGAIDTAHSQHIASTTITGGDLTILCIDFDSTVVAPQQMLATRTHAGGDGPSVGLAEVNGVREDCAGYDASIYSAEGNGWPVFIRVY